MYFNLEYCNISSYIMCIENTLYKVGESRVKGILCQGRECKIFHNYTLSKCSICFLSVIAYVFVNFFFHIIFVLKDAEIYVVPT